MRINEEGAYLGTKDTAILMWIFMILAIITASAGELWLTWAMIGASSTMFFLWFMPYVYRIRHIGQKEAKK